MKTSLKEAIDSYPSYSSVHASMDLSVNSDKLEYFPLPNPGRSRLEGDDQGKLPFALKRRKPSRDKWTLIITTIALLATILCLLIAFLVVVRGSNKTTGRRSSSMCDSGDRCSIQLRETLPDGLYSQGSLRFGSIADSWHTLLDNAHESIDIATSYWTLLDADVPGGPFPEYSKAGQVIFDKLKECATRGVKIRIVQQVPGPTVPQKDTELLAKLPNVEVRSLDFSKFQKGGGILHTKMWIVDGKHVYLGSANMDWRSLTEVKEVAILTYNCSCVASDVEKIFGTFWYMGKPGAVLPNPWPPQYDTEYDIENHMKFFDDKGQVTEAYFTSSPPSLRPMNRAQDLAGIINSMLLAKEFIYISVMDYVPVILYGYPQRYWGPLDDAIRSAAYDRGVTVRLLIGKWKHSPKEQQYFLQSLKSAGQAAKFRNGSISVKYFVVPPGKTTIPYTRVNHAKYMVADNFAYVGTSNWVGDYFLNSGDAGYVIKQVEAGKKVGNAQPFQSALKDLFIRDWESKYAQDL